MEIFYRLFLAHLLADFTLQTDYINRKKRSGLTGMLMHVFTHMLVSMALVYDALGKVWFTYFSFDFLGWHMLIILTVLHFAIDELRIWFVKSMKYPDNTFNFLADQFAHFYLIFIFSPFSFSDMSFVKEKWVVLLCLLVFVTHFSTVLIYYVEKDLSQAAFPNFDQKYFLIFERAVIWAFFLIPGWWWTVLLFFWVIQIFYVKKKRIIDMSNLNLYGGIALSVVAGLFARYIYYGI